MLLKNGDYVPDGRGGFCTLSDTEALLHRVLFQLTARRGSFPLLPELGSRLYHLPREKPAKRAALAKQYVEEALAQETALTVLAVDFRTETGELILDLVLREEQFSLSIPVAREENFI